MTTSSVLEPAYILHSRDYRDTSLIVDLLTRDSGRFSVVVGGARSAKSRTGGRLQPFSPLLIASIGRGELKTATTIDFPAPAYRLQGQNLMLGLYVNELLYRLLGRFDPVPEVYEAYEQLLSELQENRIGTASIRLFELSLLVALGYGISFEYDASNGEPVDEERRYRYIVHEGFRNTSSEDSQTFTGSELLKISAGELNDIGDAKLKHVTRSSLAVLLGDKPLKSRAPYRETRVDEWVIPEGHYFMMGDNRDQSSDSRYWGLVSEENIVGRAVAIWLHKKPGLRLPEFSRNGWIQ